MLLECRQSEYLYKVPKFNLDNSDIDDFMYELKGFHEQLSDCLQRSESRDHFYRYMAGQFAELERKSIEPIALAVCHGARRVGQKFLFQFAAGKSVIDRFIVFYDRPQYSTSASGTDRF